MPNSFFCLQEDDPDALIKPVSRRPLNADATESSVPAGARANLTGEQDSNTIGSTALSGGTHSVAASQRAAIKGGQSGTVQQQRTITIWSRYAVF